MKPGNNENKGIKRWIKGTVKKTLAGLLAGAYLVSAGVSAAGGAGSKFGAESIAAGSCDGYECCDGECSLSCAECRRRSRIADNIKRPAYYFDSAFGTYGTGHVSNFKEENYKRTGKGAGDFTEGEDYTSLPECNIKDSGCREQIHAVASHFGRVLNVKNIHENNTVTLDGKLKAGESLSTVVSSGGNSSRDLGRSGDDDVTDKASAELEDAFEEINEKGNMNALRVGHYLLTIPAAYALSVFWHETGHAVFAKAFGAVNVHYNGPNIRAGSTASVSYDIPDGKKLGRLQKSLISAGGMLFTTTGSVALEQLVLRDVIADEAKPFVAATALIMMADRWRYVLSSLTKFMLNKTSQSDDVYSIITANFKSEEAVAGAYGLLALGTCIEIGMRWNEVEYLFKTAIGEHPKHPKPSFHFSVGLDGGSARVMFGGQF